MYMYVYVYYIYVRTCTDPPAESAAAVELSGGAGPTHAAPERDGEGEGEVVCRVTRHTPHRSETRSSQRRVLAPSDGAPCSAGKRMKLDTSSSVLASARGVCV